LVQHQFLMHVEVQQFSALRHSEAISLLQGEIVSLDLLRGWLQ